MYTFCACSSNYQHMSASYRSTSFTRMVLVLIHTARWRRWGTLTSIRTAPSSSRLALTQVTWMTSVLDRAICSFSFYTLNTAAVYASLKMVGNFSAVDLGCSHGMCNEYFIISIENDCFTVDQSCSDETNLPVSVWRLRDHAAAHACTYMYIHVHVWHCADPAFQRLILFFIYIQGSCGGCGAGGCPNMGASTSFGNGLYYLETGEDEPYCLWAQHPVIAAG